MDIPESIFEQYYGAVRDFNNCNFGVTCRLIYPETRIDCPNCIYDSFLKKSSNQYQSGGPIVFNCGLCPFCDGLGYNSVASTEDIKMRVYFDKKAFTKLPVPVNLADGSVVSIGDIGDLPKILRATRVVLNTDIEPYKSYLYELDGTPVPHGFRKNQFFTAIWHQV